MEKIGEILASKWSIARSYTEGLKNIPGIQLPPNASWATNVFWLYSIVVDEKRFGCARDDLMHELKKRQIDSRPLFPPVHMQPIYATGQHLPVAEDLSQRGLSLPSSFSDSVTQVIEAIWDIHRTHASPLATSAR
jgi:perosamine synthetase